MIVQATMTSPNPHPNPSPGGRGAQQLFLLDSSVSPPDIVEQFAQDAEELALRVRRLVAQAFGVRVARELAQVLAIGARVLREQLGQRGVSVDDQALAPGLDAMQGGGVAATVGLG